MSQKPTPSTTAGYTVVIKTMFQCDLTRVASFHVRWGNSELSSPTSLRRPVCRQVLGHGWQEDSKTPEGHHDISHMGGTDPQDAIYIADKFYCDIVANLLLDMKNTPGRRIGWLAARQHARRLHGTSAAWGNPHDVVDCR